MSKTSKPNSEEEVFSVMKQYSQKKRYSFSDAQLRFYAENCFLFYESKRWCGTEYWPPLVMKWVLNEKAKFNKQTTNYKKPKPKGMSVREIIMGQEMEQENNA